MEDIDKTTRRMSSFASVDEMMVWLHRHGCDAGDVRSTIEQMWQARQHRLSLPEKFAKHKQDYLFQVRVRKNGTRFVEWRKVLRENLGVE